MSAHEKCPAARAEAILAFGHHAAANPVGGWLVRNPWVLGVAVVFLVAIGQDHPTMASLLALGLAVGLVVSAVVSSLRGAAGNVQRIINEVLERHDDV